MKKKRLKYLILFLVLMLVEILIALYVNDKVIRPYVGDILVVVVLYCFIRIFIPEKIKLLPVYIFLFAITVEIMQYFNIVQLLGLQNNKFMKVLIGTVFDFKDIICYGVGCIIIATIEFVRKGEIKNE